MPQNNVWLNYKNPSNALVPAQVDKQSNVQIVAGHGNKYNPSYNKNLFFAGATGITTSAGLATTYLGICLSNPAASTKNLAVRRVSANFDVVQATIAGVGIIVGYSAAGVVTHTTPITTLQPSFLGNATVPQGLVDSACTIVGTPAWYTFIGQLSATAPGNSGSYFVNLEGAVIIPPGGYLATGTTIASASAAFYGSIEWEEVAV